IDISNQEAIEFLKAFPKASRFLVDENLGPELAPTMRNLGYNATDVYTLKLNGRSDEDVFAAAWSERRILLTQDRDFLDDRRFPPSRNAGIVVLLGRHDEALVSALMYALEVVGKGRKLWEGARLVVYEGGRLTVTDRNQETRARETTHYKLRMAGPPLVWRTEKPKLLAG